MPFSNDRRIFYGSFDPFRLLLLPSSQGTEARVRRQQPTANSVASTDVSTVKYQSVDKGSSQSRGSGSPGMWEMTANKSGRLRLVPHSEAATPELDGLPRVISLFFFHQLRAKEVVLSRLKWLRHVTHWATVGKGAQGLELTLP